MTITTVEYDAEDAKAKEQERRKSSVSSRGITRTLSLSIQFEDRDDSLKAGIAEGQSDGPTRSNTQKPDADNAGGSSTARSKGKEKERNGSVGSNWT